MPAVFATGFMVGLMEWTCIQLLAPHLDAGEGSLGAHVDVSHMAATPPGRMSRSMRMHGGSTAGGPAFVCVPMTAST